MEQALCYCVCRDKKIFANVEPGPLKFDFFRINLLISLSKLRIGVTYKATKLKISSNVNFFITANQASTVRLKVLIILAYRIINYNMTKVIAPKGDTL